MMDCNISALKEKLRVVGEPLSGNKRDLVARILSCSAADLDRVLGPAKKVCRTNLSHLTI
jgi:hypothetical protein